MTPIQTRISQVRRVSRTVGRSALPRSLLLQEVYSDGYDENYRGDANDRAWLKTLSEREREAELLQRHEQREIIKRR